MDMQKEREAFEAYLLDQGVELKYLPSICFNGSEYDLEDDGDEEYQEALGEINTGWKTWQAAKASAVPDGYVVVLKEPTFTTMQNMHDAFDKNYLETPRHKMQQVYKAMIEAAQEQS